MNGVRYCLQDKDNFECRGRHDAASTCSVCIQSGTVLIQKQFKLERCFDHFLFYKRYYNVYYNIIISSWDTPIMYHSTL